MSYSRVDFLAEHFGRRKVSPPKSATSKGLEPFVFGDVRGSLAFGAHRQIQLKVELLRRHLLKSSSPVFRLERIWALLRAFEENPKVVLSKALNKAARYVQRRMIKHFMKERDCWGHRWAPPGLWTGEIFLRHWGKPKKKLGIWSGGLWKRLRKSPKGGRANFHRLSVRGKAIRMTIGASLMSYKPALMFQTRGPAMRFGKILGVRPARNFMSLAGWERSRVQRILMQPVIDLFKELGIEPAMRRAIEGQADTIIHGMPGALVPQEMQARGMTEPQTLGYWDEKGGYRYMPTYKGFMKEVLGPDYESKLRTMRAKRRLTAAKKLLEKDPTGAKTKARLDRYQRKQKRLGKRPEFELLKPPSTRKPREVQQRFVKETPAERKKRLRLNKKHAWRSPSGYLIDTKPTPMMTQREIKQSKHYRALSAIEKAEKRLKSFRPSAPLTKAEVLKARTKGVIGRLRNKLIDRWDDDLESMQFLERTQFILGGNLKKKRRKK